MNERWVCKRCFADNDDTDPACVRCGLTRGAEAAEQDQAAWAASGAPGAPVEQPGWRRLLRFWWIPVIGVVLLVGYLQTAQRGSDGSLTSAGTVNVNDLRVGDCFNAGDETEISDVDGVPCDEGHAYEVYAVQERDGDSYPTDAEFDAIFESVCLSAFEAYVGSPYATSELYASMITPSEGSWDDGDREYICYLLEPVDDSFTENVQLSGSMRGSGR